MRRNARTLLWGAIGLMGLVAVYQFDSDDLGPVPETQTPVADRDESAEENPLDRKTVVTERPTRPDRAPVKARKSSTSTQSNIGEFLDADVDTVFQAVAGHSEVVVNIGEPLDPESDQFGTIQTVHAPESVGVFIDADDLGMTWNSAEVEGNSVVDIGEFISADD